MKEEVAITRVEIETQPKLNRNFTETQPRLYRYIIDSLSELPHSYVLVVTLLR